MKKAEGFTIVEIITVMSIVTVLFFTSLAIFQSRQESIDFSQGVKELESFIQYETSELTSGYYPGPRNILCTIVSTIPTDPNSSKTLNFTATSSNNSAKGANKDCIYIGKVIHFGLRSTTSEIGVYFLADDTKQVLNIPVKVIKGTDVNSMKYANSPKDFYPVSNTGSRKSSMLGIIYGNRPASLSSGISNISLYKYLNVTTGESAGNSKAEQFNTLSEATKINNSEKFSYCFARNGSDGKYLVIYVSLSGNAIKTESIILNDLSSIDCA